MHTHTHLHKQVRLWVRVQEEEEEDAGIDSTLYLSAPPPGKVSKATNKMSKNGMRKNGMSAAGDSSLFRLQSPESGLGSPRAGEGTNAAARYLHTLHIRVYIRMCIRMYIRMYISIYMRMYVCTYIRIYIRITYATYIISESSDAAARPWQWSQKVFPSIPYTIVT